MDERYFTENSSSLVCNKFLTHLSIVVVDLRSSIPLIALSPALKHLHVRLASAPARWSNSTMHFLERQRWPSRVKSSHLTEHETVVDTLSLCSYIRLFSRSLKRLAFYAHLIQTHPMGNRRSFEQCLLNHLPKLNHLDFCMHTGLGKQEYKNRRSFDRWKHQRHVISIFNSWIGYDTRFTLPFVFERLERVTNDFADSHSNEAQYDSITIVYDLIPLIYDGRYH